MKSSRAWPDFRKFVNLGHPDYVPFEIKILEKDGSFLRVGMALFTLVAGEYAELPDLFQTVFLVKYLSNQVLKHILHVL